MQSDEAKVTTLLEIKKTLEELVISKTNQIEELKLEIEKLNQKYYASHK